MRRAKGIYMIFFFVLFKLNAAHEKCSPWNLSVKQINATPPPPLRFPLCFALNNGTAWTLSLTICLLHDETRLATPENALIETVDVLFFEATFWCWHQSKIIPYNLAKRGARETESEAEAEINVGHPRSRGEGGIDWKGSWQNKSGRGKRLKRRS